MTPPICALCKCAMQPDPADPDVWRCPDHPVHEFYEDAERIPVSGAARRLASTDAGMICPRGCAQMKPVPGTVGAWRCTLDASHEFLAGDRPGAGADQPPKLKPAGRTKEMERSAPFWLAHLGLTGPLSPVPQSNITDGGRCVLRGPLKHGGGGRSGRRWKRVKKDPRGV